MNLTAAFQSTVREIKSIKLCDVVLAGAAGVAISAATMHTLSGLHNAAVDRAAHKALESHKTSFIANGVLYSGQISQGYAQSRQNYTGSHTTPLATCYKLTAEPIAGKQNLPLYQRIFHADPVSVEYYDSPAYQSRLNACNPVVVLPTRNLTT